MTEDEARRFELVRAVELADRTAALLTREDREQADHHARMTASALGGSRQQQAFLASRAEFASGRLATRHKRLADQLARSAWPKWAGVVLPFAALAAGFLANEFGTDRRMDLLAVPLLGTFFWNLTVYLWVSGSALTALFGKRRSGMDALTAAIARVAGWTRRGPDEGTAVERAATAFRTRWTDLTAPLQAVRISRTLHLGAALFALGLIGGIYARALVIEYRAGWESTFLSPEAVRAVLGVVLGPASQLSGLSIRRFHRSPRCVGRAPMPGE